MKEKMRIRNGIMAVVAAGMLLVVIVGGRQVLFSRQVARLVPVRPPVSRLSAPLLDRLEVAENRARGFRSPRKGLEELVQLYHANGFLAEARAGYAGLIALDSDNARWPHRLGSILAGYGQLDDALPWLRRTVLLAPDYLPARIRLGDALAKLNRPADAAEAYQAALQRDAKNAFALLGLARLAIDAADWSAAREWLARATAAHPDFTLGWRWLATVDAQLGNQTEVAVDRAREQAGPSATDLPDPWIDELMTDCYDPYRLQVAAASAPGSSTARQWLERAVQVAPDDAGAHRQLGDLLTKLGEFPEAKRYLRRAVELAPKEADNWAYLLHTLDVSGENVIGDQVLASALAQCPDSPGLHLERGRRLERAGQHEAALMALERSRQLRPNDVDAYVEMSGVYFRLNRVDDGIAILRRALAVEPAHPVVLSTLAFCAIGTGDEVLARTTLREARAQPRVPAADLEQLVQRFMERFGRRPW